MTFYPDYTYSQFVGCFKPIAEKTVDENGETVSHITYRYVLGPFLKTYVEARKHPDQNYLLIVEEINRANPAAVFGDISNCSIGVTMGAANIRLRLLKR